MRKHILLYIVILLASGGCNTTESVKEGKALEAPNPMLENSPAKLEDSESVKERRFVETPNPLLEDRPTNLDDVDTKPSVVSCTEPDLPDELSGEIEAIVTLIVTSEGKPFKPHIDRINQPEYGYLILDFVQSMKFRPATDKGKNVSVWVKIPVYLNR